MVGRGHLFHKSFRNRILPHQKICNFITMLPIIFLIQLLISLVQHELSGKAVGISDGDTFTLLTSDHVQYKIRLHGIDCPEKKQDFGNRARQALSTLLLGKDIRVQIKGKDRYGRTVGMVYANAENINEQMLIQGMAWHYLKYDQDARWSSLEASARKLKNGLWSQQDPMAPWEWRKAKKTHSLK